MTPLITSTFSASERYARAPLLPMLYLSLLAPPGNILIALYSANPGFDLWIIARESTSRIYTYLITPEGVYPWTRYDAVLAPNSYQETLPVKAKHMYIFLSMKPYIYTDLLLSNPDVTSPMMNLHATIPAYIAHS